VDADRLARIFDRWVTPPPVDEDTIYNRHLGVFLLWACRETGVLDELLDGPKTAPEVADRTDVTERAAGIVLDALGDLGYVDAAGDEYEATDAIRVFDPDTPALERGILPHRIDSLENYMALPETMRTGEPPEPTKEGFLNFVGGMAVIEDTVVRSGVTVAEQAHPRPDRVLDVGGGPAKFSREFARRGADVTLVDRPDVIDVVRPTVSEEFGIEWVGGDARESLPQGFDLVFSARMTVSFSLEDVAGYYANAYDALDPGGTFVCMEHVRGRAEVAERFAAHMMSMAGSGNTKTEEQYRSRLEDAGFVDVDVREVPDTDFQAMIGHKPE
jgi:ubiquinone/menaquinone biosynthesis C-methylase UbiE